MADFPDEPGCISRADDDEDDRADLNAIIIDDDEDGLVDYPLDPGCGGRAFERQAEPLPQCADNSIMTETV